MLADKRALHPFVHTRTFLTSDTMAPKILKLQNLETEADGWCHSSWCSHVAYYRLLYQLELVQMVFFCVFLMTIYTIYLKFTLKVSIFLPIASHNRAFLTFTPEYILTPSPRLLWAHTQKAGHCWLRGNIGRLKNRISNHFIKGLMWSSHASYISYSTTGTSQHNIVTPPRALPLQDEGDYRNESHHYRLPPSLPPTNIPPPSIFKRTKATVVRFPKAANYSPSRCTGDGSHVVDLWSPRGGCGWEGRGLK